jgi:hypothetical protein
VKTLPGKILYWNPKKCPEMIFIAAPGVSAPQVGETYRIDGTFEKRQGQTSGEVSGTILMKVLGVLRNDYGGRWVVDGAPGIPEVADPCDEEFLRSISTGA